MTMLTVLLGRSAPDTRFSATPIAPGQSSAATTSNAPSVAPGLKAPPFVGGWIGDNWFNAHKGA
jgi:hypothetical protein